MESERRYLNVLKGFLIVLVVIGHFGQTIANNLPTQVAFIGQGIVLFIYLFHMPLFLFLVICPKMRRREDRKPLRIVHNLFTFTDFLRLVFIGSDEVGK